MLREWLYPLKFLDLKSVNVITLSKRVGLTYARVSDILKILNEKGLITKTKVGREVFIKITVEGLNLKRKLLNISEVYYRDEYKRE